MSVCTHLDQIRDIPRAEANACPDCLREHNPHWVQLRQCLTCGYIGCCESSPKRHAQAHSTASDHPLIRTIEPGEDWRWCFVDETLV